MNRKVIALVEDPFWRTKIDNAARSVGASTVFLSDPAEAAAAIEPGAPVIVVVDMALKSSPFQALSAMKTAKATIKTTVSTGAMMVKNLITFSLKTVMKVGSEAAMDGALAMVCRMSISACAARCGPRA